MFFDDGLDVPVERDQLEVRRARDRQARRGDALLQVLMKLV